MVAPDDLIPLDDAARPLFAGVDVGGTGVKIGLVDDQGRTIARTKMATLEERGPGDCIERAVRTLRGELDQLGLTMEDVAAVGLGTPGTMDIPRGMILEPPNLPHWRDFPVRDCLAAACGKQVAFANDANAAAYGEYWVGGGRDYESMVMLTLGTGVGGGIIVDHVPVDGENSHGSECGHIIIDYTDDARMCPCGQKGHLEAYASATALVKRTREALAAGRASSLTERVVEGEEVSGLMLAQEAEKGDQLSLDLILETAMYVGVGAVSLMHTIDPGAVILGGAMNFGGRDSPLGRRFLERVREEVRRRAFPIPAQKTVIDFAVLVGHAGYIGAAGIARQAYHKKQG
ncbi:MAG: ROK family protein [Planctomycetes bacterium]|nr:ROK family protein [Planctomycetota bacterium]